jgi:cytoskeletal protein RodZ
MPLDTGDIAAGEGVHHPHTPLIGPPLARDHLARLRPIKIVLGQGGHVGAALKAARETLGLAEEDIAQVTRVRAAYIGAIEAFDFAALPARPFVVGYVRAYAQALGVDAEAVVARLHAEAPRVDGKLRPPGGVRHDAFASIRWLMVVGAAVAVAVVAWNLTRRVELSAASPADAAAARRAPPQRNLAGPAQIGAPLPTPPEATTPPVYQTPGLTSAAPGPANPAAKAPSGLTDGPPGVAGAPFAPAGAVFGDPVAAASASGVVLQARKSTTLVIHGPGGSISFARLMAPGEAWRASDVTGLTADVAEPGAMEAFVGGASRGRLTQAQTPLGRLGGPPGGP